MGFQTGFDLFISRIICYKIIGEPNFVCTRRGGHCSNSHTCPSSGGNVEKLSVKCRCRKACCKCTGKERIYFSKTYRRIEYQPPSRWVKPIC